MFNNGLKSILLSTTLFAIFTLKLSATSLNATEQVVFIPTNNIIQIASATENISVISTNNIIQPVSKTSIPTKNNSIFKNKTIDIFINGIVCSFCAQGIKKTFDAHASIKHVDVNLETGSIQLTLKHFRKLTDIEITQVIEDAGYDVANIVR